MQRVNFYRRVYVFSDKEFRERLGLEGTDIVSVEWEPKLSVLGHKPEKELIVTTSEGL